MIKTIFIEPKARIAMIATLLGGACFLTYYFHVLLRSEVAFTHFFYIPIILASLWWQKKGLWVAVFLATLLIVSYNFFRVEVLTANDYLRAAMFIVIALVVAMLSERRAKSEKRVEHLNLVLSSIRNVNQLITREKNRDKLTKGICDLLVKSCGYFNIWVALLDESGKLVAHAEAGLGEDFLPMVEQLKRGKLTRCTHKALNQSEVVVTTDPSSDCADCPLAHMYSDRGALTVQLEHGGKVYGLMCVSIPKELISDREEQTLLEEVARDIALAFHNIELEEEHKRVEEELKESEEKYRSLINLEGAVGEAIVMLQDTEQGDAIQTFVSKDWPRITGYSEKELHGMSFFDLLHPKYHQASLKRHKRRMRGEAIPELLEMSIIRKDGAEVPIELTSAHTTYKGERANVAFIRDITERKRAEKEEKELMAALKRSNEELQRFAHVASHDLQEPLRMVASFTQLLAQRYRGKLDKDADEFIGYAVDGANRMQALLNDLLVYSRVDTRGKPFEMTGYEHILNQAQDNLMITIKENKAKITHDPLPTIMGDETQLVQLFQNLLSNAIKFRGKKSPRVHVSARQEGNEWVFSIRDNGVGIAPKYHDRIFVIFQRLLGREYPGTGTGLAVCKRIVERHQGRIWVKSQPGKGSTFYFTIPRGGDK